MGTVPVLRGETTSPWRKPHGPCERVQLQVTNIQAGAPPQRTHRPPAQPCSPATWGTVISCDTGAHRLTDEEKQSQLCSSSQQRGPYSLSSLHSSDLLSCAAREENRKINDISLTAHQFAPIFIDLWSFFLSWHKTAYINMTELLVLSSIHIIKNLPLTWILQLTVGQLVKTCLIMLIGQVKRERHQLSECSVNYSLLQRPMFTLIVTE